MKIPNQSFLQIYLWRIFLLLMENVFSTNIIEVCDYNQFYIFKVSFFSVFIGFWSREVTCCCGITEKLHHSKNVWGLFRNRGGLSSNSESLVSSAKVTIFFCNWLSNLSIKTEVAKRILSLVECFKYSFGFVFLKSEDLLFNILKA